MVVPWEAVLRVKELLLSSSDKLPARACQWQRTSFLSKREEETREDADAPLLLHGYERSPWSLVGHRQFRVLAAPLPSVEYKVGG